MQSETRRRTRPERRILEKRISVGEAIRPGRLYQTRFDSPPGPPTNADRNFIPISEWDTANWPPHIHLPRAEVLTP